MKSPLTVETLWQLERVGALALAPDASSAVCVLATPSMQDNTTRTRLWLLPLVKPGTPRALTLGDKDQAPDWAANGRSIAFIGQREQQGAKDKTPQLYLLPASGGEARRLSHFAPGVLAFRWMPSTRVDRQQLLFAAWVWPELRGTAAQNKRQAEWDERKESGYTTSEMQYRHWNASLPQDRVVHLHVLDVASGRITDLFEGTPYELPRDEPGLAHFDVSPDGQRVLFAHDPAPVKAGGNRIELVELTLRTRQFNTVASHKAWDFTGPRYSPDGTRIAAVATPIVRRDTPHGHASFGRLAIWPCTRAFAPRDALPWQHDVQPPLQWEADGSAIWLTAEERGQCHAWRCTPGNSSNAGRFTCEVVGGWVQQLAVAGAGAKATVATVRDSAMHPARVFVRHAVQAAQGVQGSQGAPGERRLDTFNDELLARIQLGRVEQHEVIGALDEAVQLWVVYPRAFKRNAKHPVMHVIHGGPYTASGDSFSYRWNAHVLASQGHVVVQTNYHGSSGFGEAFRLSILGRQGELELQDLKAATDWILRQPWTDRSRVFATGASYGGYLVAWMNGHWKPWPEGPIRAYVCHAGVFDRRATWSADSYLQRHKDLGGTYWAAPERVATQSPVTFAAQMKTPTLVIHGAQDFRVPDHNGLAYYNTLKARGVDARLLWFPDEGHWVLKPQNARQWYGEFLAWLGRHKACAQA